LRGQHSTKKRSDREGLVPTGKPAQNAPVAIEAAELIAAFLVSPVAPKPGLTGLAAA
jgi:hypothetical protein